MTRKRRRGLFILSGVGILAIAAILVMFALRDTIVFFHTPSEIQQGKIKHGERFRLGGLVKAGSIKRGEGTDVGFVVTDATAEIPVTYRGVLPDLFREGQGVVTEGRLEASGHFRANSVLAKHDETYMPPEVAAALKKQGVWRHGEGQNANSNGERKTP